MKFKYLAKDKISQLPKTAGVYAFLARRSFGEDGKKGGKFLYIGKAVNIRERVKQHLPSLAKRGEAGDEAKLQRPRQPSYRDYLFLDKVEKIGYIKTNSELAGPSAHLTPHPASRGSTIEAFILEAKLIKKYRPKYNIVWRDDKNYFYVGITKEDFPRVFITHQPKNLKSEILNPKSNYVGPFVDGKALKQTLKVLRKIFSYRSCYKIPSQACLWYHLGRCPAPCLLKSKIIREISPRSSLKIKKESQKNAKNLMKILKEGKSPVLKELKNEMKLASKKQEFEEAAKTRDQIEALEKVMEHAKVFEPESAFSRPEKPSWEETKVKLKKILKTKNKISRIEAYDISTIQGQTASGSMVTFTNGLPDKNSYRKFKIKVTGKPDDTAMIKETLSRRFKHKEWPGPDLILIDGGKAQLNAAVNSKLKTPNYKHIKVVALAKGENKLFIEREEKPILLKTLPRDIFNLILQLRDEAHRFARKYHHKLREIDLFPRL